MRLIFARHGQAVSNIYPNYEGLDAPLTPTGERQADLLGQWLKTYEPEIDHIIASPLQRAHKTAQIVNSYLNLPISINPDLVEMTMFEADQLAFRAHPLQPETHVEYTTETAWAAYYLDYREQVRRALATILSELDRPKPLLIVSHGGAMATLFRLIMERHDLRVISRNTALLMLRWEKGRWFIDAVNQVAHLPPDLWT